MYIPKNRIQTNLYTNGGEYVIAQTQQEYIGFYHKLYTGETFTGKNPDDSRILTPNWNDILENELKEFKIYHPLIEWGPDLNGYVHSFREIFPIYPKKLKELWGYICPHNNIDSWLYFISTKIGMSPWNISFITYLDNLSVSHYQIPDETSQDKIDQIDKIHGLADKHENSKELYHAINLLEEYIHYLKWKELNKHNIINEFRNQYL